MSDLLVKNAGQTSGDTLDILIRNGVIADVGSTIDAVADDFPVMDARGYLVTVPFVDSHFHLDATLSYGLPRVNQSGTLLEEYISG